MNDGTAHGTQQGVEGLGELTERARRSLLLTVPKELTDISQWVCWRFQQRDGQPKPTKVPVTPTGTPASTTDPSTWGSFLAVNQYFARDLSVAGFGFVFTQHDPYVGIDLDNAVDDAGTLTPLADSIVKRLNSYTEFSVSGKGLHIIVKGTLPEGRGRKNPATGVEAYCSSRYFVMSGCHMAGTPTTVEDRQDVLDVLIPELFGVRPVDTATPLPSGLGNSLSDTELIDRAKTGANGEQFTLLWEGRWQDAEYPSQSEADLALCSSLAFWTNRDEARVDSLFRRSGLMRPKWDREDYRTGTLRRAMENPNGYSGIFKNPFPRHATPADVLPALMKTRVLDGQGAVPATDSATPHEVPTPTQLLALDAVKQEALKQAALVHNYGPPFTMNKNGVSINQTYLAAKFRLDHTILYEPTVGEFYSYDQDRGLWVKQTEATIKTELAADIKQLGDANGVDGLTMRCTDAFLTAVVRLLRGYAEERDPFTQRKHIIHLQNGMLDLDATPPVLRPFSPDYRSRNQSPIAYDPQACCPRFLEQLLQPVLSPEDIDLLQRWAGMALIGTNLAQRLMIQAGEPGAGKGTFANIVEGIIGLENVAQLRTSFLSERFELYGFLDRTLLSGKDVPGNFLNDRGAYVIKALVGDDLLDAEKKGGNRFQIRGNFNMLISTNSRLRVKLDGDTDAWRRRLLIVEYGKRPETVKTQPELYKVLLREEAPGILNWMIAGAVNLLGNLDQTGSYTLTTRQNDRISSLLSESDSVREFVRKRIRRSDTGDLTGEEVTRAYTEFCEDKGWDPLPVRRVEGLLRDVMHEVHRSAKRNDIKREEKSHKGYAHVEFVPEGEP